jgi:hypothetical protein
MKAGMMSPQVRSVDTEDNDVRVRYEDGCEVLFKPFCRAGKRAVIGFRSFTLMKDGKVAVEYTGKATLNGGSANDNCLVRADGFTHKEIAGYWQAALDHIAANLPESDALGCSASQAMLIYPRTLLKLSVTYLAQVREGNFRKGPPPVRQVSDTPPLR